MNVFAGYQHRIGACQDFNPRNQHKLSDFKPAAYCQWEPKVTNFGGYYGYNSGLDASQFPAGEEGIGERITLAALLVLFVSGSPPVELAEGGFDHGRRRAEAA